MNQPPHNPWGAPPPPPTLTAWNPPPVTAWAPSANASERAPQAKVSLDNELQTWLIVACVGWFVGFMWITGPLSWWKAGDLRQRYEALGVAVPSNVNALRLLGILTTVMCVVAFVAVCMGVAVFGLFAASNVAPR